MRHVILTLEAVARLNDQIDYLLERNAVSAARLLRIRVSDVLTQTLASYPSTGKYIAERSLWETWTPSHLPKSPRRYKGLIWQRFPDSRGDPRRGHTA
jgi:plasmid stabilization system protein ParE